MTILDKKYSLTINLEDSSVSTPKKMFFFNTDKNIANMYVKVQYRDGVIKYLTREEALNYNIKLTIIKPKNNLIREIKGVITDDLGTDYAMYKFELSSEFTDQVGVVVCEFTVINGIEELTINSFSYTIESSKVTGLNQEIISSPDLPVLKQLIEDVKSAQQWISNIDDTNSSEVKTYSSKKIETLKTDIFNQLNYVDYEQFGAKGDGITNDYAAIKLAHNYANLNNLPIKADSAKTYYISNITEPIPIKTNVNWNNCKFKIEEKASPSIYDIFQVVSNYNPIAIDDLLNITINKRTKNIPSLAGYGYCLVDVINTNKKQFIRKGVNADTGYSQTDQFLIDNQGNVLNDIIWDFDNITSLTLYPIDNDILTVENVKFITIENNIVGTDYLRKGLLINRSNTVVKNISHEIIENSTQNSPSRGIVYFNTCANVVFRDSKICSRLVYNYAGTYDLNYYKVVNATIENVIDTNFLDTNRWGCHTSNYGKDFKFYNCKLSRIDSHRGIWNLTIRDTEVGNQGLRLTGGGNLILDNFKSYAGNLVSFRSDYGSTWNGRVRAKNITHTPKNIGTDTVKIFAFDNDMTHDFGYQCYHTLGIQMENYYLYNYGDNGNNGVFDLVSISSSDFVNALENCRVNFPYELTFKNIKCNDGGFRLIEGYLHGFRVGTSFSYIVGTENYNTTSRSLYINNNVSITLDDIKLATTASNNTIVLKGMGRQTDDAYVDINTRILPKITIKDCYNVVNDLMGFAFILECYNCILTSNNIVASGARNVSTFTNCTFVPSPADTSTLVFRFNGVSTVFINCYFKEPVYTTGSINTNTLLNCYSFLNYGGVTTSDSSFRSYCSFIGCRIDTTINPTAIFPALNSFNYDFNSSHGLKYKR